MKNIVSALAFLLLLASQTSPVLAAREKAPEGYTYAHPDAEYSINLPEAPTAITIWADDEENPVPYLDKPPKYGAVGEKASFKRIDIDTGDTFETTITFLRADNTFLLSLSPEKMKKTLSEEFSGIQMDNTQFNFSPGTGTLKWATITGFSIDQTSGLFYNVAHYISGQESIMVIKIRYNVENKGFQKYFDDVSGSIKYTGK